METTLELSREIFSPQDIFESGQTFRFWPTETGYAGVAHGVLIEVQETAQGFALHAQMTEAEMRRYFDLDRDYAGLFADADPVLKEAVAHAPGLRVLHQEPFETLVSFIISANNNIPRIQSIIERLCRDAGTAVQSHGRVYHAFPSAGQLSEMSEERLRQLGCGYRAPYIARSCKMALHTDWNALESLSYTEAKEQLLAFPGVGSKVADCICLFSLGKAEAFPVDVWIERILRHLYGFDGTRRQMEAFAREKFGPAAGIAQQYLFHYARHALPRGK